MDPGHLELRRVERQQALIERLQAAHGARVPLAELARDLGVLGPTASESAASAMKKLVEAMRDPESG